MSRLFDDLKKIEARTEQSKAAQQVPPALQQGKNTEQSPLDGNPGHTLGNRILLILVLLAAVLGLLFWPQPQSTPLLPTRQGETPPALPPATNAPNPMSTLESSSAEQTQKLPATEFPSEQQEQRSDARQSPPAQSGLDANTQPALSDSRPPKTETSTPPTPNTGENKRISFSPAEPVPSQQDSTTAVLLSQEEAPSPSKETATTPTRRQTATSPPATTEPPPAVSITENTPPPRVSPTTKALQLWQQGAREQALTLLEHPPVPLNAEEALFFVRLLVEHGQLERAFDKILTTRPTPELRGKYFGMLGFLAHKNGKGYLSQESYRRAIAAEPNELSWRLGMIRVQIDMHETAEAQHLASDTLLMLKESGREVPEVESYLREMLGG